MEENPGVNQPHVSYRFGHNHLFGETLSQDIVADMALEDMIRIVVFISAEDASDIGHTFRYGPEELEELIIFVCRDQGLGELSQHNDVRAEPPKCVNQVVVKPQPGVKVFRGRADSLDCFQDIGWIVGQFGIGSADETGAGHHPRTQQDETVGPDLVSFFRTGDLKRLIRTGRVAYQHYDPRPDPPLHHFDKERDEPVVIGEGEWRPHSSRLSESEERRSDRSERRFPQDLLVLPLVAADTVQVDDQYVRVTLIVEIGHRVPDHARNLCRKTPHMLGRDRHAVLGERPRTFRNTVCGQCVNGLCKMRRSTPSVDDNYRQPVCVLIAVTPLFIALLIVYFAEPRGIIF